MIQENWGGGRLAWILRALFNDRGGASKGLEILETINDIDILFLKVSQNSIHVTEIGFQ